MKKSATFLNNHNDKISIQTNRTSKTFEKFKVDKHESAYKNDSNAWPRSTDAVCIVLCNVNSSRFSYILFVPRVDFFEGNMHFLVGRPLLYDEKAPHNGKMAPHRRPVVNKLYVNPRWPLLIRHFSINSLHMDVWNVFLYFTTSIQYEKITKNDLNRWIFKC